jgi:HK97 family phage major capsid protein
MTTKNDDPVALVAQIGEEIKAIKKSGEEINTELKKTVTASAADAKAALDKANELSEKVIASATAITEIEQKLAAGVIKGKVAPKTLGDTIISSEEFKAFAAGKTQKFRIEANTITGQTGSPPANSDTLVPADRLPGIIPGAFRSLRVADVLPAGTTVSNNVEYTRELLFTNAAEETAEGDTKKQSTLTFELANAPVRTIAHFLKASKQILDDAPALQSYIDTRLRYGVDLRWDKQLLRGNGSNQNISGILATGNYTAFTPTASEIALDSINRMIEAVGLADYNPTAIIMHTADWHAIERLKVGGTSNPNQYVVGEPLGVINRVLWGLPVVVTNQMHQGRAVVGAFDIAYQAFTRQTTVVEMFEQDDTNVQKNLLTIRAEKRGCLATYRPASVVAGLLISGSSAP